MKVRSRSGPHPNPPPQAGAGIELPPLRSGGGLGWGRIALGHSLLIVLTAITLTACGKQEPAPDPLKAQRSAIQKAKGVNDVVTGAAADQRKQIDDQETK